MPNKCVKVGVNRLYFGQDMEDLVFSELAVAKIFVNNLLNFCARNINRITFVQVGL